MTIYLVKHGSNNYKLHEEDGAEIYSAWENKPDKKDMADQLSDPWRLEFEGYNYRDLTISEETVPWQ